MTDSKRMAGLVGPTMIAIGVTEAINMDVFATQFAPVVYLNGAILFVAGLAIQSFARTIAGLGDGLSS